MVTALVAGGRTPSADFISGRFVLWRFVLWANKNRKFKIKTVGAFFRKFSKSAPAVLYMDFEKGAFVRNTGRDGTGSFSLRAAAFGGSTKRPQAFCALSGVFPQSGKRRLARRGKLPVSSRSVF